MAIGSAVVRWVVTGLTLLVVLPVIIGIIYLTRGFYLAGAAALGCAPAILWVVVSGYRYARFRLDLPIQLYSTSGAAEPASTQAGSGYPSQGGEPGLPAQCRFCDAPMNLPSPICPRCGRKND